jgi:hypothetical protein
VIDEVLGVAIAGKPHVPASANPLQSDPRDISIPPLDRRQGSVRTLHQHTDSYKTASLDET